MPTTVLDLRRFKDEGQRFVMLTCYDYQCAQIFDEVGIPLIFVGDTLGIFVLGYDTTIPVTMEVTVPLGPRQSCGALRTSRWRSMDLHRVGPSGSD
jgi:ketopantoate hydroxymethyltransferase